MICSCIILTDDPNAGPTHEARGQFQRTKAAGLVKVVPAGYGDRPPGKQNLIILPPGESTLDGRWTRKPFGLSRVQPIYLYMYLADCICRFYFQTNEIKTASNVTLCYLALLSSITEKKVFLSIFSYPFNTLNTDLLISSVVKPHSFRRIS